MVIDENDALQVFNGIDSMPEDMRPRAASLLADYKAQQDAMGAPLWPTQDKARRDRRNRVHEIFNNPLILDAENGAFIEANKAKPGFGDKLRAREASILYLADRYGADETDVRNRFDFYKAETSQQWGAGALDDSAFFAKAKSEIEAQKTKAETLKSASAAAFESALRGGVDLLDFSAWQLENEHLPEAFGDARKVWEKTREDVEKTLGEDGRAAASRAFRAMRAMTGVSQESDAWINEAKSDLINLRVRSPKAYKLALAAVQVMAADAGKVEKGVVQGMGENVGRRTSDLASSFLFARPLVEMSQDVSEAMVKAGLTNAENPEQLAAQIRARREVENDIRDISRGVIDPVKSEREGWVGFAEDAAYLSASSLPFTVSIMIPGGTSAASGLFTSISYNEFRRNGWEGADAAAASVVSGVFQTAVEKASEVIIKIPGVAGVLNKFGVKPGSSWATQFFLRAGMRYGVEVSEEAIQEATTPFIQELAHAIMPSIPDTPEGKHLSDVMSSFFEADNFVPLLLSVIPLGLIGAGMSTSRDMDIMEDARRFFGDKAAAEIMAESDTAKRDSMIREKFNALSAADIARIARDGMNQSTVSADAQRRFRQDLSAEAAKTGITMYRDGEGWKVQTLSGSVINVDSEEAAVRYVTDLRLSGEAYEAESMIALADDLVQAFPGTMLELSPSQLSADNENGLVLFNPVTGKKTVIKDAKSLENLWREASAVQSGSQAPQSVLGDNFMEFGQSIARVFRRGRGGNDVPQAITAMHEVIEAAWRKGVMAGQWTVDGTRQILATLAPTLEAGIANLGKKAQAEELRWLDNIKKAITSNDENLIREVFVEMAVRTWIGRDRDGNKTGLRPGTILRALDSAILQEKSPENVTTFQRLRAWFKAVGAYLKGVVATAKIIRDAERNGTIDDFTGFLDKVLGIDTATREENEVKDGVIDMAFSLAPEMQSRAKPQTIAPVTEMPDGFRLVGPSTFSIQAYQGTPHKFKPETKYRLTDGREVWLVDGEDTIPEGASEIGKAPAGRIRLSKMGTGEGVQAYGWGGYAAENREVGEMYRDTITAAKSEMFKQRDRLQDIIRARDKAQERLDADPQGKYASIEVERIAEFSSEIEALQSQIAAAENARGNLYTLELLPDADEFLDWDKPLSEQSEKVRGAVEKVITDRTGRIAFGRSGAEIYRNFLAEVRIDGSSPPRLVSQKMASLGIPGIRYLDAGSRGDGDGTHNYVIFDENIVRILEENGKPVDSTYSLASSPGGLNEADDGVNMAFSLATRLVSGRISDEQFLGDPSWKSIRDAIENIDPSAKRGVSKKPTNTGTKDAELASLFRSGFTTSANSKEDVRGGEHTVEFRNGRAYKQTHPETFGAKFDPSDPKNLKWGTPLEYLTRWRLFNEIFPGAGVKFEGVVMHPNGALSLKISQPEMKGENPTVEQLKTTLEGAGWKNIALNTWQKNGITMTDAKTSNFVVQDGLVIPLDVILSGEVKAGSTFSLAPTEQDAEYLAAVEDGDMTKVQAMVNEAAKAAAGKSNIVLYRGLENQMDPSYDGSHRDSPQGYSTWTDSILLARQYAGENGFVYAVFIPKTEVKSEYIDSDGERAFIYPTGKKAGLNKIGGKEFLLYEDHESFNPNQIKSADPVTYDDAGNIIPLSQRFNPETPNTRFSLSPQSGIDIVSDTLESWQDVFDKAAKRNPTRAMAIRDLAQQRINRLGEMWAADRWTAKGDKIRAVVEKRTKGSLDDEQAMREALLEGEKLAANMEASQAKAEAKAEAAEWRQEADDMQADDWSPRESLVRDMRVLNVALSAFPPEVRAKVTGGSMVKLAGLTTERARYKAIQKALEKAIVETEKFMRKEYTAQIKAVFARYEPDAKSGEKPKGKLGPDVQEIYNAAKAAIGLTAEQTQAELARLDSLIAADGITPEQELNMTRQRGLVELLGDWKNANSGRMSAALESLEDTLSEGWASWKLRQILIREGREESRKELRSATKKKGLGKERDAMRDEAATTLGKASSALLNLSSFSDVMKYAFGAVNKAKEFISRERIASNAYEDAIQLIGDRVQDFFTAMGGGSVIAGERIRYDLAHSRVKVGSGESERNLTQMQGIQALLMWQQEDGRRHMEGPKDESGKPIEGKWSYDEAWIADLESKLTPEAKSVKLFLQQLYSEEWAPLNAIYREIHGINLPRHELYAPLTVKPQQAKQGEMVDPVSGAAITGSILTPGSLRSRNRTAQAEPDFRDALAVFLGHTKQMEYWKNYYQLAVDLSAVLGNREVMNAVEASIGGEGVTVLRKWIDAIAQGGFRDAAAQMEISQIMSRVAGRAATVALLGRVSTLLVQSTQIAAASVRMPVGAYLKRLGKLTTGNLSWGDAIKSDFIQRRIKQAPPIIRQAMNDLGTASRPNAITAAVRYLGNLISGADGLFTAGTYAILLDWHRAQGAKMGLEGAELDAYAHDMAATITEEVAQPVRMANRSLMEITSTNPLAKVSWAYSSEARQKIALFFWAAKTAKADPAKFGKTAFLTFIVGGLVSQVLKNLWREAKGDDDEKKWSVERLTTATLAGPLHGIPMASEIMGNPGQLSSIAWSKAALEDVFTGDADMHDVQTLLSVSGYFNDNLAGIGALGNLGFDFAKIIKAATEDD